MSVKNLVPRVLKGFYSATRRLAWIGYAALAVIVLVTFVDGSGRYLLNRPVTGAYELVQAVMIILGGFAIMHTTVERGHVAVDLVLARFPERGRAMVGRVASLLGFGAWAVIAYWRFHTLPDLSEGLGGSVYIPLLPFLLTLVFAICLCCLTLLIQAVYPVVWEETAGKKEKEP